MARSGPPCKQDFCCGSTDRSYARRHRPLPMCRRSDGWHDGGAARPYHHCHGSSTVAKGFRRPDGLADDPANGRGASDCVVQHDHRLSQDLAPPVPTMMRLVRRVSSPFLGGSWRASRCCPLTVPQASKSIALRPSRAGGAVALSEGQGCVALIWIKDTSLVLGQVA